MSTLGTPAAYDSLKRELIGSLTGTVLEIGAGKGANLQSLARADRWIGLEPSASRRRALRRKADRFRGTADVLAGRAERLPVEDASVDAVLATIVLCSVRDQERVLAEVVRVLRPGGAFVFFEHVVPPAGTWSNRAARAWAPVSRVVDHGCDPRRRTWEAIERSDLAIDELRWFELPMGFGVRSPYIGGRATKPASAP
ncbi:class I SAM-dependent methyltransferase [Solicola gregarius]|uniref:Class I SAM-dependent methyltransferase n=1 Tax=Solicola gregarius TaxID=2908642 RepID=A0AA46TK97_9ACTN|nr:class I SAM-dependent methyltransferase [Solicola gregarius]UYM06650.1 class I SAM-dependent methyltransferase [Solicola gregarius]